MEYLRFIFSSISSLFINLFHKNKGKYNNILIVRLDHFGDMVCTLHSISNIRRNFPESKIILIAGDWNLPFFQNNNLVDDVIVYDSPAFTRDKNKVTGLKERIKIYKNLIKTKFDLIIGFRDDFFTILFSFLLFPSRRVDRGSVRIKLKFQQFFNKKIKIDQHEIETNKKIIYPLLNQYIEQNDFFKFDKDEELWLNNFLLKNNLKRKSYAVIHPGASWEFKRWDVKNFRGIGIALYNNYNLTPVIIGAKDEAPLGEAITKDINNIFIDVTGKTELRQTIQLIAEAAIAVCNDSAPMHIASQLGIPTVGLMGPADIEKFSPRGKQTVFLHKKVECYPCAQKICVKSELPCVNLINVSEVESKISGLMKGKVLTEDE